MELSSIICSILLSSGIHYADLACENMQTVVEVAEENNIPVEILNSLIFTESSWSPKAVSKSGACGLTQVMPKYTGGKATGGVKYTCKQLTSNPKLAIEVGAKVYRYWLTNYARCRTSQCRNYQHKVALCGYNAGYRCKGDAPNKQGMGYANVVLSRARKLKRSIKKAQAKQGK